MVSIVQHGLAMQVPKYKYDRDKSEKKGWICKNERRRRTNAGRFIAANQSQFRNHLPDKDVCAAAAGSEHDKW